MELIENLSLSFDKQQYRLTSHLICEFHNFRNWLDVAKELSVPKHRGWTERIYVSYKLSENTFTLHPYIVKIMFSIKYLSVRERREKFHRVTRVQIVTNIKIRQEKHI